MRNGFGPRRSAAAAAAVLGLFLTAYLFGQEIDMAGSRIVPQAVDQGGRGDLTTTNNKLDGSAGEVGTSSMGFTSSSLYPGLMSLIASPGPVADLGGAAQSSVAVALTWSAPGYDGSLGALQAGSSYYIQSSTWAGVAWSFAAAQVTFATQAVNPGDGQGILDSGLWPNTTHFFRLWTRDAAGNLSVLSNGATVATLARQPQPGGQPYRMVGVSSVTLAWGTFALSPASVTAEGYRLEACSAEDFSGDILSSFTPNVGLSTLTVSGLFSNTTYYFRVGAFNWNGLANYALAGSTLTYPSVDVTAPSAVADLAASTQSATQALLQWSAPSDPDDIPLSGTYAIEYATYTSGVVYSTTGAQVSFSTSGVAGGGAQSRLVSGLSPNTTYYFRLWTADAKPNWSGLSNGATVATLANAVGGVHFVAMATGSASLGWGALPPTPSSYTAEGYRLEASSTNFGAYLPGGQVYSSATVRVAASTLTVSGLDPNTTYYYRVASLNWAAAPNYTATLSSPTLANLATALAPAFLGVFNSSVTANWAALPTTPSSGTSEGYRLEASSTNFGAYLPGGQVYSSVTASVLASTLTVQSLSPNTTYYYRVASLNWAGAPDYTTLSATSTLADVPVAPSVLQTFVSSATLSWGLPASGAQGYSAAASSTNFGALYPGGLVISSTTGNGSLTSLTVLGFDPNTTYYYRVASLNWNGVPNYTAALSSPTLANAAAKLATDFLAVYPTSATARWAALPQTPSSATSEGYRLEASSTNFGAYLPGGQVYSSVTASVLASTLTVQSLSPNTTYYYRVASLNWAGAPDYTTLSATSTLANAPVSVASTFTSASNTSLSAQWSGNANPSWTQYVLQLSTAPDFTGTISSAAGTGVTGSVGLDPNTTYYARVEAVNSNGLATAFTALGSSATLATQPGAAAPAFSPVYFSSLTVSFTAGTPANPAGTLYEVQVSSYVDFSSYFASATLNAFATFQGLSINATYYGQVRARNRSGLYTDFTDLSSTATLAVAPGPVASTFSAILANGFIMTWASGAALTGYNSDGTTYAAQVSTAADFTGAILESVVKSTTTGFSGLDPATTYYARVRAVNYQNVPTTFTSYGWATTIRPPTPMFFPTTFWIGDSLGSYIDPSLYTDTTTPKLRINVQADVAPGLSVTDTPSHLTLWHLDDGAGTLGMDSSYHRKDLVLGGAPAPSWATGELGGALQFDGNQNYTVSPTLVPWRDSAANSQFTVSLWFNSSLGKGYLFQTANLNTSPAGTYDGELSWYRSTGRLTFEVTTTGAVRQYVQATKSYADGAWHCVTAVLNTVGMYLYVDGQLANSGTGVNSTSSQLYAGPTYAWVGAGGTLATNTGGAAASRFYPGLIDEVLIATVAFTADQAAAYCSLTGQTHGWGAPQVDVSTQSGVDSTWVRLSTRTFTVTGANGSTAAQAWTSTMSLQAPLLAQSPWPASIANQVMFLAASLDANQTTAQFTILVDTTPPSVPGYSALSAPTTYGLTLNGLSSADDLSGLNAAPFKVQASTASGFGIVNGDSGFIAGPDSSFTGLNPNTTYYVRALARDAAGTQGNQSAWTANQSLATLAVTPSTATPAFLGVFFTSATVGWIAFPPTPSSRSAQGYQLDASTAADFTGTLRSSATASVLASTLTVANLDPNTTWYFRVGALNHAGLRSYITLAATSTLANPPQAIAPPFLAVFLSSMTARWAALPPAPSSASAEGYRLEASSTNFSALAPGGQVYSSVTASVLASTLTVQGLDPNTTYYYRVASRNWNNVTSYTTLSSTSSLANAPTVPNLKGVYVSSVTMAWGTFPPNPSSMTAEGYRLEACSDADFSGDILSSFTPNVGLSTLTVSGLFSNTTYYFRVGAFNWNGLANYALAGSTLTRPSVDVTEPSTVADLAASTQSATQALLQWSAPSDPDDIPLSGTYAIEYATYTSGVVYSTTDAQVSFSTSGVAGGSAQSRLVPGLSPNTTHYFRLWSADAKPNWSALSNGATMATLANAVGGVHFVAMATGSASLGWGALPPAPSSYTAEGYRLEASSTNFSAYLPGGQVYSSATARVAASTLTVSGLDPNTTYYYRVASLNWNGVPNYTAALSSPTLANLVTTLAPAFLGVFSSSATARWAALPQTPSSATSEGYRLEASSTNFGAYLPGGQVYSSVTASVLASTLTVQGLDPDTTYYYRAASLNWAGAPDYTTLSATSTLANAPVSVASTFTSASNTSLSAQWSGNANPSWTQYVLQLSTAPDFTGTISSAAGTGVTGSVGLDPNTTYYARVEAVNSNGLATAFTALGSSATLATQPGAGSPAFSPVYFSSLTVAWTAGAPVNPAGTLYEVQVSSYVDFSSYFASATLNASATFQGLSVNATYYGQVRARNRSGLYTDFTDLSSTATLAVAPGPVVSTYSNLTANSFTMTWASGTALTGYNSDGTSYAAQISTAADFTGTILESVVTSTSADFSGLVSGTAYYARVRAFNYQNIPSTFTLYGFVTTLNSAKPAFVPATFEVGDSLGSYIDPSLYTDTTTPKLRVRVQSNFSPGLSVTDTPSHLTLWHLDDGAGTVGMDSSYHRKDLVLGGAPAPSWAAGELGGALQFDGTQNYAVSPTLVPWRSSAADSQFTVSLWFNSNLGKGYLFQTANLNTSPAGTYDGELSWYRSTGRLTFEVTTTGAVRRYVQAPQSYADGAWHCVTAVLNTVGMYLYVDGQLANSGTQVNSTTAQLYAGPTYAWVGAGGTLGANTGGAAASRFYPGLIDEVLIATVAFTADQAAAYCSLTGQTHGWGAPQVDVSTQSGVDSTWVRLSTRTFTVTGANGSTAAQAWTSTMSLQAPLLAQSPWPASIANQVMFLAASLDANQTTAQFTILVDTTPPSVPGYSALSAPTTYGLTLNGLSSADDLSGLNAAPFKVQASTASGFGIVNGDSGFIAGPDSSFTGLNPNTTYYVRALARDAAGTQGNQSAWTANQSLATLAVTPSTATPAFLGVFFTSATVGWIAFPPTPSSRSAQGYQLDASTAPDFTGTLRSSATASVLASTLTVANLDPNTTWYFRVGALNHAGLRSYITLAATSTLANPPQAIAPPFLAVFLSSMTARWAALPQTPSSATAEGYRLEASSTNFSALAPGGQVYSSVTASVLASTLTVQGLDPNTTYYYRVASRNWNNVTSYTTLSSTSSLANAPTVPNLKGVYVSSVTMAWGTFPPNPSSMTAEGYRLEACSDADFSGDILSSFTPNVGLSTLTVSGLFSNTTYYFRVGAFNWNGLANYALAGSTLTRPSVDVTEPSTVADLAASTQSATQALLQWSAPSDPDDIPLSGTYAIEYATYTSGVVYSTTDAQVSFSTSGVAGGSAQSRLVPGLSPNTTHYFRLWSADAKPNWSALSNGATMATLANAVGGVHFVAMATGSASLGWGALPPAPSSYTAEGYRLETSSTNFSAYLPGGQVYSSATARVAASTLTVSGLDPNTTYYYRVASLNWNGVPNYTAALSSPTLANLVTTLAPAFLGVFSSSATARWAALPQTPSSATSEGYRLEASSTNFGAYLPGGQVYSSVTASVLASTLTVQGLDPDTTYYYRAASLNWAGAPDYTTLSATSTLANAPVSVASTFTSASNTSLSAQWSGNANPSWTQYVLQLSTAPDFTGTISSAAGTGVTGSVGLDPNTTYYARVEAVNSNGLATAFTALGSSATLATQPGAGSPAFSPVYFSSLTVAWTAGAPVNPAGTLYEVQVSSYVDFSSYFASATLNASATFQGLSVNATYYGQVRARNRSGLYTDFTDLSSTATLAVAPGPVVSTYSNLTANSFTMTWASGTALTGYNSDGTSYAAQISTAADFTGTILESVVTSTSADFSGLVSGTAYYARVRAFNYQNIPSTFTLYGFVTTLNSAKPAFVPATFEVGDSLGSYIDPSLYTDTTTPKLRVRVQSNFSPGLSVTDTPSHLTLWHLDDGAGTVGMDSSYHRKDLVLGGAPAPSWATGELGGALQFDGNQNYTVSPTLVPWRDSAANSQFTVSLWFNSSLGKGYLFQTANLNTSPAGTYDGELSWYRSTGRLTFEVTTTGAVRQYVQATKSYADGAWHCVTAVLNTVGMYLYVDGQLANSGTGVNSTSSQLYAGPTYAWVGAGGTLATNTGGAAASRFYPGLIDEVLIATVAFTADQAAAYCSLTGQTHGWGAPQVDVSTQSGVDSTWVRLSTRTSALTGANGSTAAQAWTSTMSLQAPLLAQTPWPSSIANQVMFLAASLDANQTTAQFTILVDTTPPSVPGYSALSAPTTYGLTLSGLSSSDDLSGLNAAPFKVQASTASGFGIVNGDSGFIAGPDSSFTGLNPNTTYYVRALARDAAGTQGNQSAWTANQSLATLAVTPSTATPAFLGVFFTSATVGWIAFPPTPSSRSAQGYQLDASTAPDFTGTLRSSATASVLASTLTVANLDPNTTWYFRVGALNHAGLRSYITLAATSTLANPPQAIAPPFLAVFLSSMTARWAALPPAPSSASAEGYRLEASSTNFSALAPGGQVYSSVTASVLASTLTVQGLDPNTTYYARVTALNWNGAASSYTVLGSTSTLAPAVTRLAVDYQYVFFTSATLQWAALPPSPSSRTAEGYLLQASDTEDFSGTVRSSATPNVLCTTLTVSGLDFTTTWYMRVGSLNHNSAANLVGLTKLIMYSSASADALSLGTLDPRLYASTVSINSIVVTNKGSLPVTLVVWGSTATPGGSPWSLGTAPDIETVYLQGLWNTAAPPAGDFAAADAITTSTTTSTGSNYTGDQSGVAVPPGESRTMWFQFWRPTSTVRNTKEVIRVDVRPIYP